MFIPKHDQLELCVMEMFGRGTMVPWNECMLCILYRNCTKEFDLWGNEIPNSPPCFMGNEPLPIEERFPQQIKRIKDTVNEGKMWIEVFLNNSK